MNDNLDRSIDPGTALKQLQQFVGLEISRLYVEIAVRDAYIQTLEKKIQIQSNGDKDGSLPV